MWPWVNLFARCRPRLRLVCRADAPFLDDLVLERRRYDLGHLPRALIGEVHRIVDVAVTPVAGTRQVDQCDLLAARHLARNGIEIVEQVGLAAGPRTGARQLLAIDERAAALGRRARLDIDLGHQNRRDAPGA